MSEDPRPEGAECTGGVEVESRQCGRNRVRRENPRWRSARGQTKFALRHELSPGDALPG